MKIVKMNEMYAMKKEFIAKHGANGKYEKYVTPLVNDEYSEQIAFEDGATWYEHNRPVYETVEVEVKGVKTEAVVKLFETEFWSTEFGSHYVYEKSLFRELNC